MWRSVCAWPWDIFRADDFVFRSQPRPHLTRENPHVLEEIQIPALALLGDQDQVKKISSRINTEAYYKLQACRNLLGMGEHGYLLSADMNTHMKELFCGGTPQ